MKTPDEIKKDAETCMSHPHTYSCNSCRLYSECHGIAEHIIKELYDLVVSYESRLAQVERERDAAADDARLGTMCDTCKHNNSKDYSNKPCYKCDEAFNYWEWRGICPENTKEE